LDSEERHRRIVIQFISTNQGCTAEQLVDGVDKELSRVTVYKTLRYLLDKGLVQDRATNRRDHKFFVDINNPLFSIPQQLEEIEAMFKELLDKSKTAWRNIDKRRFNATATNIDLFFALTKGVKSWVYFAPAVILRLITDTITIYSTTIWINKFRDKDTFNRLLTNVFMKLASLNGSYVEYLNEIQHSRPERVKFDDAVITRNSSPLQLMYASRRIYKEIDMEKQIDKMLDLLWKFNEDIRILLFPEIKLYKWDTKYNVNNWRNILEIYENNPNQTIHNLLFP
jgi:predicted transcriptional regulator